MTDGRRWLALDADLFGKPFISDLHHEFGWAGVGTWVSFLCACKRSRTPGTIRFLNEADARAQLGILGWDLADSDGKEWTLEDFWAFTGRKKQTRRTSRGREMNVTATHWRRWQDAERTQHERERKRRSRAQNGRDIVPPDSDLDLDISPLPLIAPTSDVSANGGRRGDSPKTRRPQDPVIDRIRTCIPGTGWPAAAAVVSRLRAAGVGDTVIDEAAGYAAEHGAASAHYVEELARDWMAQRDPTWSPNG